MYLWGLFSPPPPSLNDSSLAERGAAYDWRVSHVYFGWQMQSARVSADGSIYIALLSLNNIILAENQRPIIIHSAPVKFACTATPVNHRVPTSQ